MITAEGYTADEIVALPVEELREPIFVDRPITFSVGTAEVLGQFRLDDDRIVIELAHIDGGGEGILPFLAGIGERCARACNLSSLEWIVHALTCAKPNSELRAMLERRGFVPDHYRGHPVLRAVKSIQSNTTNRFET
jgi:hypothetical protein